MVITSAYECTLLEHFGHINDNFLFICRAVLVHAFFSQETNFEEREFEGKSPILKYSSLWQQKTIFCVANNVEYSPLRILRGG